MTVVRIVLGGVAYVVGVFAVATAFNVYVWRANDNDDALTGAMVGVMWPASLPALLVIAALFGIGVASAALGKRIAAWRKRR